MHFANILFGALAGREDKVGAGAEVLGLCGKTGAGRKNLYSVGNTLAAVT